jgi:hypothetical protein
MEPLPQYFAMEAVEDSPILQGDVFRWIDRSFERPWSTYGVVVTADCDLLNQKTRGSVSYVPAFLMEDYIWHHWKEGKFEAASSALLKKFAARINNRLERIGQSQSVSAQAALEWLERVGIDGLFTELAITDNGQKRELFAVADELLTLTALLRTAVPDLKLLQRCYAIKNKKNQIEANDFSALANEIQSSISNLPGDVFFLPLESSGEAAGLFVMLRHIKQCDISAIATRVADMTFGSAQAKRLGRIGAPYRYAITQNLARVFSDIGLPTSYEKLRDASSSHFFKTE